jgi:glycosyltransferase involved in cell wall biosynthesis
VKVLFIKEKRSESGVEGIATYLLGVCVELNRLNIPYLVLYNAKDLFYEKMLQHNINVKILEFPSISAKNMFFKYIDILKIRRIIHNIVKSENITHISVHFPSLLSFIESKWGVSIIAHSHGAFSDNKPMKYFYLRDFFYPKKLLNSFYRKHIVFNFNKADKVICSGKSAEETAINKYCIDRGKIFLNMYGSVQKNIINIKDIRKELGLSINDKLIISVGRETKAKGVEEFCEVAKALSSKKHYKFFYLGGYRDEIYHDSLLEKYGKYVKLLGMKINIDEYYKASDMMLFLSYREAGGMVLFESMNFSLPMVVWDTVGVNELVVNGFNGYLCPIKNVQYAANKVDEILSNDDVYGELSSNSKKEYDEKYNFKFHVGRLLTIFQKPNINQDRSRI